MSVRELRQSISKSTVVGKDADGLPGKDDPNNRSFRSRTKSRLSQYGLDGLEVRARSARARTPTPFPNPRRIRRRSRWFNNNRAGGV